MEDLKRCPFCGELPICGVEFYESRATEVKLCAVVRCPKCNIEKRVVFNASHPISLIPFWDYDKAFDKVMREWNKRAEIE